MATFYLLAELLPEAHKISRLACSGSRKVSRKFATKTRTIPLETCNLHWHFAILLFRHLSCTRRITQLTSLCAGVEVSEFIFASLHSQHFSQFIVFPVLGSVCLEEAVFAPFFVCREERPANTANNKKDRKLRLALFRQPDPRAK